jgi:class 3 adenylate cyclase
MKDIAEYTSTTSPYELLSLLTDKIVKGELTTFQGLHEYCAALPDSPKTEAILRRAFDLQKKLYWGYFKDISPSTHPKVWSKVVVPDRKYRFAGDIKRLATIPDLYMSIIDIHGYTKFCQKHRHNMSMLDLLDRILQQDVPAIAAARGVVSRRARGDEILLLAGSAHELFEVVFLIMKLLAKESPAGKPDSSAKAASSSKPGEGESGLPAFQISAGIAGGAKYSQLVITRDGDLSGSIVNTAARLQARANKISPERTKILIASVTYQKIRNLPKGAPRYEYSSAVDFFDTGLVEFKGINVSVMDTIFLPEEKSRVEYRDRMGSLYDSVRQGLWGSKIFADALNLMARIFSANPGGFTDAATGEPIDATDSISAMSRIKKMQTLFAAERYEQAIAEFNGLVSDYSRARERDLVVIEYLNIVRKNYRKLLDSFAKMLDREIDERLEAIFLNQNDRTNYRTLEKHHAMFSNVRDAARLKVPDRKAIWAKAAESSADKLGVSIKARK